MVKIVDRQKTEWGYVEWVHLPETVKHNMSVGIVTMNPHTHARRHIHYGQEQMVYVIEGKGLYYINDEKTAFQSGDFFVMESDCSHETINDSDDMVKELLVSVTVGGRNVSGGRTPSSFDRIADGNETYFLYQAAGGLKENMIKTSNVPYTLFDINARPLLQSNGFPDVCKRYCDPVNETSKCECFRAKFGNSDKDGNWFSHTCEHGIKVFLCPIGYNGKLVGMVRGGHFFTSEKGAVNKGADYDVPRTAQIAIHSVLEQIVETIEKYIEYLASVSDLKEKENKLDEAMDQKDRLQDSLSKVNEKVTNLKINHHFLFNTLNCMSAMALDGDRSDLYQSIIDLSKMFRYTMTTELRMTEIRHEVNYLKAYLNLQKLRYKDGLQIIYDIDEDCLGEMIPFNSLQPIVENAFTHGFMSFDHNKEVKIIIRKKDNEIKIEMYNNGVAPAKADLNLVMDNWKSGNGHGLSLIYDKLRACYKDGFDMRIDVTDDGFTLVSVRIPCKGAADDQSSDNR